MLKAMKAELSQRLISLSFGLCLSFASMGARANDTGEAKLVEEYPVYQSAQDLNYGRVLYEYHQGHFFEALSALNVAKLRSGIQGHGQHPELVEGGLMLAYGMIDDAKAVFDALLDKQISPNDRNLAWFYLGKVFFLMENDRLSFDSFANVQESLLQENNEALYYELLYMKGLLILRDDSIELAPRQAQLEALTASLPLNNIWRMYLEYNAALDYLNVQDSNNIGSAKSKSITTLKNLAEALIDEADAERINLREQALLSLGQLYLQQGNNELAFAALQGIRKEGLLSYQALFAYAVASSNMGQHGLALKALTTLRERPQFTPWIQQVPYALAYLYEQMSETELALEAYRVAVKHYESLQNDLSGKQASINEERLLAALDLLQPLGDDKLINDAYGKLNVQPSDFSFSHLLASESFQGKLSDLHELYKLEASLARWAKQLDSFDTMMTTRITLRQEKIQDTSEAMAEQNADLWESERSKFEQALNKASQREDLRFFMNEEQIEYQNRIHKAEETLALIPKDNRKRKRYEDRLNRVKAYYEWWLSESFSVNRWAAMKEMRALNQEMRHFHQHQSQLNRIMESDGGNEKLALRVKQGRQRLAEIQQELSLSLANVREELLALARQDYQTQIGEAQIYLQASREALARISDQVYHSSITSKVPEKGVKP